MPPAAKTVLPPHKFYHGVITGKDAETRLQQNGGICFLLRYSRNHKKYFLVVVNFDQEVENFELEIDNDIPSYQIKGTGLKFHSLDELIKHYQSKPLSELVINIGKPCYPQLRFDTTESVMKNEPQLRFDTTESVMKNEPQLRFDTTESVMKNEPHYTLDNNRQPKFWKKCLPCLK